MVSEVNAGSGLLVRLSEDPRFRRFVEARSVSRDLVSRYVAGQSVSSALDVAGELLARGRLVSFSHLTTDPNNEYEARERRKRIRRVLRRAGQAGYTDRERAEVCVRPGALGARLPGTGREIALENLRVVAAAAEAVGARITVESEPWVPAEVTLALAMEVHTEHPTTGVELWSSRGRTEGDVTDCIDAGVRVRLSLGNDEAGSEESGALSPPQADLAYVRSTETLMRSNLPFSVSAQDRRVENICEALESRTGRPGRSFEYHLRMGERPFAEATISDRGDHMRVYVPFGENWYPYVVNRLAVQPSQVGLLLLPSRRR